MRFCPLTGELRMMDTHFTGGELIEQRVRVEACVLGDLPHPFGAAFELCEPSFKLSNLILPDYTACLPAGLAGRCCSIAASLAAWLWIAL